MCIIHHWYNYQLVLVFCLCPLVPDFYIFSLFIHMGCCSILAELRYLVIIYYFAQRNNSPDCFDQTECFRRKLDYTKQIDVGHKKVNADTIVSTSPRNNY